MNPIRCTANIVCILAMGCLMGACVSAGQKRANSLYESLPTVGTHKDDFIRKMGPPAICTPLSSGEICEWKREQKSSESYAVPVFGMWISETDENHERETIRIEFNTEATSVGHRVIVARNKDEFVAPKAKE